jgi:hypothetical protein
VMAVVQILPSLGEMICGFGCHRSMPSRRNSDISPVRFCQPPAWKCIAFMTAPVSSRMSVSISAHRHDSFQKLSGSWLNTAMS